MFINKNKKTLGFAMIELLVYLGIFGVVVAMLTGILTSVTKTQVEESAQNDVAGQLNFAMQTIQRLVKTSSIINSEIGVATSTLSLIMPNSAYNPTQIYSSNGTLYIKQGDNASLSITSNKVRVDILEFKRLVQAGARDVVQIDLVLSGVAEVEGKILTRALRSAVSRASAVTFDSDLLPAVDNSYNVGASPATRWKDGSYSGNLTVGGSATAGSFCLSGNCITTWTSGGGGTWGSITGTLSAQTDLQSALDAKIPYTGGTTNVNLGVHNLTVDTNSLFVDSVNHRVGIGTTGPMAKLTVQTSTAPTFADNANNLRLEYAGGYSDGAIGAGLVFAQQYAVGDPTALIRVGGIYGVKKNSGSFGGGLSFYTQGTLSTDMTEKMRIDYLGNVGIGTTSPQAKLDVNGGIQLPNSATIVLGTTWGSGNLTFYNGVTDFGSWGASGLVTNTGIKSADGGLPNTPAYGFRDSAGMGMYRPVNNELGFTTNSLERIRISSNGNVGIGTTDPTTKLHLSGTTPYLYLENTTASADGVGNKISFYNPITDYQGGIEVKRNGGITDAYKDMLFYAGGNPTTPMMAIKGSGRVGIGTTSPVAQLHVVGSQPRVGLTDSSAANMYMSFGLADSYFSIIGKENARNFVSGYHTENFGIGEDAPTANLQVGQHTAGMGTVSNSAGGTTVTGVLTQFLNTFKVGDTITINGETVAISAIASNTSMTTAAITGANSNVAYTLVGGKRFGVLGNGNVGIGTTTPAAKLDIADTTLAGSGSLAGSALNIAQTWNTTGSPTAIKLNVTNTASGAGSLLADLQVGGVSKFKIDSAGNVTIASNAGTELISSGASSFQITSGGGLALLAGASSNLSFGAGGTTGLMTLLSGGNVGIGTASPDANYKITTSAGGIKSESTTQPAGYFNSSSGYGLLVNTGNVGIGTVTPTYKLDIVGITRTNDDIYISDSSKGLILQDTFTGTCKRITLTNGSLVLSTVTCPH